MNIKKNTVGVVIPTYNGGNLWEKVVASLQAQQSYFDQILVIDSDSKDNTVAIAQEAGFTVVKISSSVFDYGNTRNIGLSKVNCDIIIFMTQDAILMDNAISSIINVFEDENVALAYGRQLPHDNASPIAQHARLFNYKDNSYTYDLDDKDINGIKVAFSSNTFAAYRKTHFNKIGGFSNKINASEDMHIAAKALVHGYKVSYVAEAVCKHSHNYTPLHEFKRYFDIGVFHQNEPWIIKTFGKLEGEGLKFLLSEILFLCKKKKVHWIPFAILNNLFKFLGYKTGSVYKKLPYKLCILFSACKPYWRKA
jgi:rhamnosyltransferase